MDPKIEHIYDINYPLVDIDSTQLKSRLCLYPLKKDKVEAHREYCKKCVSDFSEMHQKSCEDFGIYSMSKWFQEISKETFILVHTEGSPVDRSGQQEVKSPEWSKASQILMDHTGLEYDQMRADIVPICQSSKPTAIHN